MINLPIRKCHSAQTHVRIVNKAGDSDIYLISALIPVSKSMACKVSTLVPVNWLESKKDRKNIALVPRKTWILEAEKRYSPTQDHNRRGSRWIGLGSVVVFYPHGTLHTFQRSTELFVFPAEPSLGTRWSYFTGRPVCRSFFPTSQPANNTMDTSVEKESID